MSSRNDLKVCVTKRAIGVICIFLCSQSIMAYLKKVITASKMGLCQGISWSYGSSCTDEKTNKMQICLKKTAFNYSKDGLVYENIRFNNGKKKLNHYVK